MLGFFCLGFASPGFCAVYDVSFLCLRGVGLVFIDLCFLAIEFGLSLLWVFCVVELVLDD